MGYAQTTIVMYGINLTEEQAEKVWEVAHDADLISPWVTQDADGQSFQEWDEDELAYSILGTQGFLEDDLDLIDQRRMTVSMRAQGTDSRIHNLCYENGFPHVFGIYMASNGYAYCDDLSEVLNGVPKQAKDNWEKYASKLLSRSGVHIDIEPMVLVISQVW